MLFSSKKIEKKDTLGQNPFDINIDINNSLWSYEIGEGHSKLETFCWIMYEHAPSSEYEKI